MTPSTKTKVLVIGLDGATFDLIKPWAAQGHLPTLNHLLHNGVHAPLRSTMPPMTAPAWTSFATGVNPGKHCIFDFLNRAIGSMSWQTYALFTLKTVSIGFVVALITCKMALSLSGFSARVLEIMPRVFAKSALATLIISVALTILF